MKTTLAFIAAFLITLTGCGGIIRLFVQNSEPWTIWETSNEISNATIDHGSWDGFLKKNVHSGKNGITCINYNKVATDEKNALAKYIDTLAGFEIKKYNKKEQRAYWINLYNALTVKIIIDHYPVDSIKDISIGGAGPWDHKLISVEGVMLSLNDIEHRILRPLWKDPRTHYIINCASIGCPNLQPVAVTSSNIDLFLEKAAREYVNHPRGVTISDGKLSVSSIYVWFRDDFGESDSDVIRHIQRYALSSLRDELNKREDFDDHDYDWRLNDCDRLNIIDK